MGFEAYSVLVCPEKDSPLWSGNDLTTLERLVTKIKAEWPAFQTDEITVAHLQYPKLSEEVFLVHGTPEGLFQMMARLDSQQGSITLSLRFAYCNPPSVYEPFCLVITGLMQKYRMYCQVMSDLAPEQADVSDEITDPQEVCAVLLPSIAYNRKLWQLDAGTTEEAILRPEEALARFITPLYLTEETTAVK